MTSEERLDRLERIAKLIVRAGLRERHRLVEQNEKIDIIIDAQIKNEERFARLAEAQSKLAESQLNTDKRLDALIDIVRQGRNGSSS